MIKSFIVPQLKKRRAFSRSIWQQDGASPHVAAEVKLLLLKTFGNCVISRGFPNAWPANSHDLNPLDFWLLSYLKAKLFQSANRPTTFSQLKELIKINLSAISQKNVTFSCRKCCASFKRLYGEKWRTF